MKNIFTQKIILTLVSVLIITIVTILSCKKMDEISSPEGSHALASFYSKSLIASFKQESIAKEFLRELSGISIKVVNGILSFNSVEDLNKVYDLIIAYTDKYDDLVGNNENYSQYVQSEQMPDYIMSYLFESQLGFYSLRTEIEEQVIQLERGGGIPDDNDPDDHYTVSPYMRTLLTPQCELIINDLICVYYDTYGIGIMDFDWKTLKELHQHQSKNNFDERKALEFCSGKTNAFFLTTGHEPTLSASFGYTVDSNTPNTVQFINYSCSEAYKDMEYFWDFGDGFTSTERNPTHTFTPGTKGSGICLTVGLPNSNNSKDLPNTTCIPSPPPPNTPYINASEGNNGLVSFTIMNFSIATVHSCTWNFGDQTGQQQFGASAFASHTYSKNGLYNVSVTMRLKDMVTDVPLYVTVQVKKISTGGGTCCLEKNARKPYKNYTYDNGNRRIKQVMRVTNGFGLHRIVAKTKNQKKNSNGDWVAKNVDEISVGCVGTIYKQDDNSGCWNCICSMPVDMVQTVKKNYNQRVLDEGTAGMSFGVIKESLRATHYVKDDGIIIINGPGNAAVHDEPCN